MKRVLLSAIFILTLVSSMGLILADATNTTEGFAGSVQDATTGAQIISGDITLNISTQASCTAGVIYTETFTNNLTYGVFSIHAGNFNVPLNQQYGSVYYYCYNINNGTVSETFGAYPFTSGKGMIGAEDLNISFGYNATSIATIEGTLDDGNLTSIQAIDTNWYNVSEVGGGNPLLVEVNFTEVVSFSHILIRTLYSGGSGHEIEIQSWNYDDGVWEIHGTITDQSTMQEVVINILDPASHVSGGLVQLRFDHLGNGNPAHDLFIDFVGLHQGFTTITTNQHNSLLGRDNPNNHPWAFPTDASREVTGQLNGTSALFTGNGTFDCIDIDGSMRCTWSDFGNISGYGTNNRIVRWDGTSAIQDSSWEISDSGYLRRIGAGDGIIYLNDGSGEDGRIRANSVDALPEIYMKDQIFIKAADDVVIELGAAGFFNIKEGAVERWQVHGATGDVIQKGNLQVKGKKEIRFYDNGNYVGFEPPSLSANQIWILPNADGNANDFLQTNGAGILRWNTSSGTGNSTSWNRSGTNVFLANTGDNTGIGTIVPTQKADVRGATNTTNLIVNSLANCDTINTTANGTLICGTDENTKPPIFAPVQFSPAGALAATEAVVGDHYVWTITGQSRQLVHMNSFVVPADYTASLTCNVIVIDLSGGPRIGAIIDLDWGTIGEVPATHTATVGYIALGGNGLIKIPFPPFGIGEPNVGDYIGTKITDTGIIGNTDFHVMGVHCTYS